ncbi:hypothetical protein CWE27_03285 [Streptomyces sp. EAG2]|nr:hypothetical protein CWE27_03285 [Streptomyces sp. EAG2]
MIPPVRSWRSSGAITFTYPRHVAVGGTHACLISGVEAVRGVSRAVVSSYESRVSRKLCPVGWSASGTLTLLMDEEGVVYGGYDDFLVEVQRGGRRALCAIHAREKPRRVVPE